MHNRGRIFHIQRFSTSDGPGIRTVVFLKGCPLRCAWCHNPESQRAAAEIFYKQEMCIGCRACSGACPQGGHSFLQGVHHFERGQCTACAQCAAVCSAGALELCGEEKSAGEIMDVVLRDVSFYEESGGGITLSGGEPLMQYDFSLSLLQLAKQHHLHTAMETSGFSGRELTAISEYTDLWLYDIKIFPEKEHIKYTGVSNKTILENLDFLDSTGAEIILRCPLIPDVNLTEEHGEAIARLSHRLRHVAAIHLEPYHPLGISKAQQLNRTQSYCNGEFLEPSAVEPFAALVRAGTDTQVLII